MRLTQHTIFKQSRQLVTHLIKSKKVQAGLLCAMALCLICVALFGLVEKHKATRNPNPIISNDVVTWSTQTPDETRPKCSEYKVTDDKPRMIRIPSLDIEACIQPVGRDQHQAVAVPTNIHIAGWYVDSALPGQSGVSLIDGHVSGRYEKAVFSELKNSDKNDEIIIEYGDKSTKTFSVISVDTLSAADTAQKMLQKNNDIDSQLNLVTCSGSYDKKTQQFDKRILVTSRRIR